MGNTEENDGNGYSGKLVGKTIRDNDNNSTVLIIPEKFAKALGIENSKVSLSLLGDCDGDKLLLITKIHKEIIIN